MTWLVRRLPFLILLALPLSAQTVTAVGRTFFRNTVVPYSVVHGRAVFEGDIDLGPASQMTDRMPSALPAKAGQPQSAYAANPELRWPDGAIPYLIDDDVPNQQRILDAIASWRATTPIRLNQRGSEANYVHFIRQQSAGTCLSAIGMVGGEQFIRVDDACTANTLTHEIGHVIGLYHEQSRNDRDYYLTVNLANADKARLSDIAISGIRNTGGGFFDYGSIMEYSRLSLGRDRQMVVIETIPAGIPIDGSGHGLSAADIDRVNRMYGVTPTATTITSNPESLQVVVDGETVVTPKAFQWASGSRHTVDVPEKQGDGTPTRYLFGRWSDNLARTHTVVASPDITVYSVSFIRQFLVRTGVATTGGGTVAVAPATPDNYYAEGAQVTVTATPAEGFTFQGWSGLVYTTSDGLGLPTNSFRVMAANLNYTAAFTRSAFLTINTEPPNLPLTINGNRASAPRNFVVNPGGTVTVAADPVIAFSTATTRYVFDSWSDGGAASHTITAPASGPFPAITAKYKVQHLVQTAFSGDGAIGVTPQSADGYYDHGANIQITATPSNGFQLFQWIGDLSGNTLSQSLTVDGQIYAQASFLQPFTLSSTSVVNAADFQFTAVSPGEILTIFGMSLGPKDLAGLSLDGSGNVSASAGGVRVLFDGVPAPMVYAAENQVAPIVPYSVAGKASTIVQLEYNGMRTPAIALPVAQAAPALFTLDGSGRGQVAAFNQDGSLNSAAKPAQKGSVVVLYATGEGQTAPAGIDGKIAGDVPLPVPAAAVTALVGGPPGLGKPAVVAYAGAAPTLVAGVMQLNLVIPEDAPSGNVPISVIVNGVSSGDIATVAVQ